ncbi:MAG: dipeptide epimerase [Sphingopyxis sp.]|nr:dipeptide epimerase [Sphingopyxis sp.]
MPTSLATSIEPWRTRDSFRIAGLEINEIDFLLVRLVRDGVEGRGEAAGVGYRGDLPAAMVPQIESLRAEIERGMDRAALNGILPACGARNALDCAMWELDARLAGAPVWRLAGLRRPGPVESVFTIGIDTPGVMAGKACALAGARCLKLKLGGDGGDAERIRAVRAARPDAWIGVDANRSYTLASLDAMVSVFADCGVALVEQPLEIGCEADMAAVDLPMPVAADESVQDIDDLEVLVGRFDIVNIKLDKCGGLTHALAMERRARELGFGVMVGNMLGTSWSHAPALLFAQRCDVADLDGPYLMAGDRSPGLVYANGRVDCPPGVWGD